MDCQKKSQMARMKKNTKRTHSYPFSSVNLEMTVPKVKSDLLMNAPSFRRSTSVEAFSDPAKSIRFN